MYLSTDLLYCNRGEPILALQFDDAALQIAETDRNNDVDCCLIYEKMLSIANEPDHSSALLGIYNELSRVTCVLEDNDYQLVCLTKIAELSKKLNCERKTDIITTILVGFMRETNIFFSLSSTRKKAFK